MIGAIIGDVVGSRFEFDNTKSKSFKFFNEKCGFTDDTVMTLAVGESLVRSYRKDKFETLSAVTEETLRDIGWYYPYCGYGGRFFQWMFHEDMGPYNSCGNGSAMRISAVGDIARDIEEAKDLSYNVTAITHNHPEGLKGAEAAAIASVMARQGKSKKEICKYIEDNYYDLSTTVREYRNTIDGHGKEICQVTMPQAFRCFMEGFSFDSVIRNCISIGGDSDTIAAIAGGIAENYYGVPNKRKQAVRHFLDARQLKLLDRFENFRKFYEGGNNGGKHNA